MRNNTIFLCHISWSIENGIKFQEKDDWVFIVGQRNLINFVEYFLKLGICWNLNIYSTIFMQMMLVKQAICKKSLDRTESNNFLGPCTISDIYFWSHIDFFFFEQEKVWTRKRVEKVESFIVLWHFFWNFDFLKASVLSMSHVP